MFLINYINYSTFLCRFGISVLFNQFQNTFYFLMFGSICNRNAKSVKNVYMFEIFGFIQFISKYIGFLNIFGSICDRNEKSVNFVCPFEIFCLDHLLVEVCVENVSSVMSHWLVIDDSV